MMETIHARHVVLGAGAMGAATAYHLARRGAPVLLVERFHVGHDRGSSHGAARITRHSYADPVYARLMSQAFDAWRVLEADAGQPIYVRTGGVSISPAGTGYVAAVAANLAELGVPCRRMTAPELHGALAQFQVPAECEAVFEPDAGLLAARKAVALQVALARHLGGERTRVVEDCPIERIDLEASKPTVVGADVRIVADRLVVAAGAWVTRLLPQLGVPLRPNRQQVLYFRPRDPAPWAIGQFPVFIYKGLTELTDYYGMPAGLGCGVKVARHGGADVDPDAVDRTIGEDYRDTVRGFLRNHIPGIADAPIDREEICLYTLAPDDRFLVDAWPGRPDVVVASPCSGHGFKFSNLVGRVLADLVTEGQTAVDIAGWRLPAAQAGAR